MKHLCHLCWLQLPENKYLIWPVMFTSLLHSFIHLYTFTVFLNSCKSQYFVFQILLPQRSPRTPAPRTRRTTYRDTCTCFYWGRPFTVSGAPPCILWAWLLLMTAYRPLLPRYMLVGKHRIHRDLCITLFQVLITS